MVITTLSMHLPLAVGYIGTPSGDRVLEAVHLVESARYHLNKLDEYITGNGTAPNGFLSGTDIRGKALDEHWRVMASLFEFESFLSDTKRCIDKFWWCLGSQLKIGKKDIGKHDIDTMYRAITKLDKELKMQEAREVILNSSYYQSLKNAWEKWGEELTNIRNYVEHEAPFGGRGFVYTDLDSRKIKIMIPDRVGDRENRIPKNELTYSSQRVAENYTKDVMNKLDILANDLLHNGYVVKYLSESGLDQLDLKRPIENQIPK